MTPGATFTNPLTSLSEDGHPQGEDESSLGFQEQKRPEYLVCTTAGFKTSTFYYGILFGFYCTVVILSFILTDDTSSTLPAAFFCTLYYHSKDLWPVAGAAVLG